MSKITNHEKRARWMSLIEEQDKSGLSQEEFCKAHDLSSSSFVYYRGIFRGNNKSHGKFVPVSVTKSTTLHEIRLTLPNGFQCAFPPDLESSRIREIVGIFLSC